METIARLRWWAPLAIFSLAACSTGSDDIRDGWKATQQVIDEGVARAQIQSRDADLDASGEAIDVSVKVDCPSGGSAQIDGSFDGEGVIDVSLSFSRCKAEDVTINGDLNFYMEIVETATNFRFEAFYRGSLEWSGSVRMSCDIDMSFLVVDDRVTIEGHVCGESADTILDQEDF